MTPEVQVQGTVSERADVRLRSEDSKSSKRTDPALLRSGTVHVEKWCNLFHLFPCCIGWSKLVPADNGDVVMMVVAVVMTEVKWLEGAVCVSIS